MDSFDPPFYLRNAHIQTILNSQGPRELRAIAVLRKLEPVQLILEAEDGTRLLAELDRAPKPVNQLVVLLHGWEGSGRAAYVVTTAAQLLAQGFDVLRLNLRDHGDSHHLNRELFNSTRSPEVASALVGFIARQRYAAIHIGGFSLGGSFALRVAADRGSDLGLRSAFAVCPPIDPARAMHALNHGWWVYEHFFFRKWRNSLRRKLEIFPDLGYTEALTSAKTLDDLNRMFIPQHTEYDRVEDYFAAYSIVDDRLADLAVPAYLIACEDDPIIPVDDIDRIDAIEHLHIETYRFGGHCGFIESLAGKSWIERRIVDLVLEHGATAVP